MYGVGCIFKEVVSKNLTEKTFEKKDLKEVRTQDKQKSFQGTGNRKGKQALSREHARGLKDVYGGKEWVRGGMAEEGAWGGAGQVDAMTLTLSLSQMGND